MGLLFALASCKRGPRLETPAPGERPLAGYVAQRLAVAPTGIVRGADSLGWVQQLGGPLSVARKLDTSLVAALNDRGMTGRWILPADLARSYDRNRSYAADPYRLALEEVRGPRFVTASQYGEPLSSQLRTMVALLEDARFVMLPIELRFERDASAGRAVVRLAILDPRLAEAKWVGEVRGDASSTPARALANVAARLLDLFLPP